MKLIPSIIVMFSVIAINIAIKFIFSIPTVESVRGFSLSEIPSLATVIACTILLVTLDCAYIPQQEEGRGHLFDDEQPKHDLCGYLGFWILTIVFQAVFLPYSFILNFIVSIIVWVYSKRVTKIVI